MPPIALVVVTTVIAFASLYAPQPLLPRLSSELGVSADQAGLLISVTLAPLALAPIFYGALLGSMSARKMLRYGVFGLALSQYAFAVAPNFYGLLAARAFQGLLLPAVFTSLMTYLSTTAQRAQVRRVMGIYVASTILGGLLGRLFAGATVTAGLPWRGTFVIIAVALSLAWLGLSRLPVDAQVGFTRFRLEALKGLWSQPLFRRSYAVIFLVFFVFASLLNLLPFRLSVLDAELSELAIAASYSSYIVGVFIALSSVTVARWLGGEVRALRVGLALMLIAVAGFATSNVILVFGLMWVLCAGMFIVHALLSGLLNQHAAQAKGLVNGAYLASYYLGGTLGASAPAVLERQAGWSPYLVLLAAALCCALYFAFRLDLRRPI